MANIELQSTLYNLAQCSRQLHLCTIPYLYHHVRIREDVPEKLPTSISYEKMREEQRNKRLRHLASVLLRRPDLAGLVGCFTLHDIKQKRGESNDSDSSECYEELKDLGISEGNVTPKAVEVDLAFKTAINAWSVKKDEADVWLSELDNNGDCHPDVILAFLLPALPKLERLVLPFELYFRGNYLERIIRRAACREKPFDIKPAFEALKVFVYSQKAFTKHMSTGYFAALLRLPAIQEISASVVYDFGEFLSANENEGWTFRDIESASSQLARLDLALTPLIPGDMRQVFQVSKALRTVFYRTTFNGINFTHLRYALEPQKNSLCCLGFEYFEDYESSLASSTARRHLEPMPSFVMFDTLKIFKTVAIFLEKTEKGKKPDRLVNIFPPSIETLHLTRCQSGFESLLEALGYLLGPESPQELPLLKKIILEEKHSKDLLSLDVHETTVGRLSTAAEARGVSIVLMEVLRLEGKKTSDTASLKTRRGSK